MVGITGQGKALIPKAGSKLLANVKAQTPNKMGMAKQSSQARKQQAEAPASTYRGIVTWFDSGKKFGFLRARPGRGGNDGDAEDIFVHLRQVQVAGWQDLQKGDTVFFEVENRRGQKCAINLRKQYDRPAANLKLAATEAKSATSVPVRGKQAQKPVETQSAKNSKNTLGALLRAAGCPQHLAVMQENEFDVESLGLAELEDLVEIGIPRRDGERILAAAAGGNAGADIGSLLRHASTDSGGESDSDSESEDSTSGMAAAHEGVVHELCSEALLVLYSDLSLVLGPQQEQLKRLADLPAVLSVDVSGTGE